MLEDIPPETMIWVKLIIAAILFLPAMIFVRFALFLILPKSIIHFMTGKKKSPNPMPAAITCSNAHTNAGKIPKRRVC